MKKTMASNLTLVTGMGRVPVTRNQIAAWQRRIDASRELGARGRRR